MLGPLMADTIDKIEKQYEGREVEVIAAAIVIELDAPDEELEIIKVNDTNMRVSSTRGMLEHAIEMLRAQSETS